MKFLKHVFSFSKDDEFKKVTILGIKFKKRYAVKKAKNPQKKVTPLWCTQTNKTFCLQNLYYTHGQTFPQFKNINYGKEVTIIATGPTLADYQPIEGCVNIGLNRAYQYDKVKLDYLFAQDGTATSTYIDEIAKLDDVKKFYGRSLYNEVYRPNVRIPEKYLLSPNSYEFYNSVYSDFEIKPNLAVYPLFTQASVSFPALHFALYTHPKKIYLVGCDTTSAPYWDGKEREQEYLEIKDRVNSTMLSGYYRLREFAKIYYPDVEIISINPVGLKGIFKDIYTK